MEYRLCWWKRKSLECFLSETASDRISVERIYMIIHVIVIALHLSQTICWPILYSLWLKAQKINFSWGTIFFSHLHRVIILKQKYIDIPIVFLASLLCIVNQQFKKFYNVLYFKGQYFKCHLKYRTLKISRDSKYQDLKFEQEVNTFDFCFYYYFFLSTQFRVFLKLTMVLKLKKKKEAFVLM